MEEQENDRRSRRAPFPSAATQVRAAAEDQAHAPRCRDKTVMKGAFEVEYAELSHEITTGMQVYPDLPRPQITAIVNHEQSREFYQGKAEFYLGRIELAANSATYIDSPFHRYPEAPDLSQIPLADVAGLPGIVVDGRAGADRAVTFDAEPSGLAGHAVLVRTGWDARWGTDAYWEPAPFLSAQALDLLVRSRPRLVGTDAWNIDDIFDPGRPAHSRLLADGILIVENLCNLGALRAAAFRFFAIPLRIVGGASIPVRAFAELETTSEA